MQMNTAIGSSNSRLNDGTLFVTIKGGKMTCQTLEAGGTVEIDSCEAHKFRELERSPLEHFPPKCGCDCACDELYVSPVEEFAVNLTNAINEKVATSVDPIYPASE